MNSNSTDLGVTSNLDVIDQFLQPGGCFLIDAGCGDMSLSRQLAARGASVLAIDPDPVQAEKNRQADTIVNVGFTQTGAQTIPVEPASVDGVLFSYSLHHIPKADFRAVFDEMRRILKPEGFVYIMEPVAAGPLNEVMQLFHDEREVRAAAQQAIDEIAMPMFSDVQIAEYCVPVRFDSWDDFANKYTAHSYNTQYSAQDVRTDEVRKTFLQAGHSTGFNFQTPVKVTYLKNLTQTTVS